jgi:hypothetical protein
MILGDKPFIFEVVLSHNGMVNYYSESMSGIGYARCDWFSEFRRVAMGELLKGKGSQSVPKVQKD